MQCTNYNTKYNGRVNVIEPDPNVLFSIKERVPVDSKAVNVYRTSLQGNWEESPLSYAFFSKQNIQIIQNGIRYGVFQLSKGQYIIPPQKVEEIAIVMRSTFLSYSANLQFEISKQIEELNKIVIDYCVRDIYSQAQSYMKYLQDVSTLRTPIDRPIMSNNNSKKTLELRGQIGFGSGKPTRYIIDPFN